MLAACSRFYRQAIAAVNMHLAAARCPWRVGAAAGTGAACAGAARPCAALPLRPLVTLQQPGSTNASWEHPSLLARSMQARRSIWALPGPCRGMRKAASAVAGDGSGSPGGGSEMTGEVLLVLELFTSPKSLFALPAFQRPYDWTEEDAGKMIDDFLSEIPEGATDLSSVEPYLLGSINLSTDGPPTGREGQRKKHVVDGQQRLVTLCLLFAAARARFLAAGEQHADFAQDLQELLVEKGNQLLSQEPQPRIQLLRQDNSDFLNQPLLNREFQEQELHAARLQGESQPKLWANMRLYREAMEALELPRLQLLVKFVLQRVRITVTTSSDVSTALKFFTVSSQRGKQLQPIDVLKGHVFNVAVMPAGKQEEYGRRWGELERQEGVQREGLSRVCGLLETIHLKKAKGSSNEFEELQRLFFQMTEGCSAAAAGEAGPAFFDRVLLPYTELYVELATDQYRLSDSSCSEEKAREVQHLLACLNRMRPTKGDAVQEWEPLALAVLMQHRLGWLSTPALVELLRDLETRAWLWALCRTTKAKRSQQILQALQDLGLGGPPAPADGSGSTGGAPTWPQQQELVPSITSSACPSLALTEEEAREFLGRLRGEMYGSLPGRTLISLLVRLNEQALTRSGVSHLIFDAADKSLTVEHVLPQKPAAKAGWDAAFSPEQQAHWTNRLGNLVLLQGRRNSLASNRSFAEKKAAYQGRLKEIGLTSLPLTDLVCKLEAWTPEAAAEQQRRMEQLAVATWRLTLPHLQG